MVNLHVKDFVIRRADHMMGFVLQGTPAGQGMLNLPIIFKILKEQRRDFNAILELWTPPEKTIEETIATEFGWAVTSINYLQGLLKE